MVSLPLTDTCKDSDLFIYYRSSMSGAYVIVQQLFNTFQPTAVGIAHFLNALLNFTIAGGTSPVIVEYMNKEGATRVMIFSRQKLSAAFSVSLGNVVVACVRSLTRTVNRMLWKLSE
jgi:hypothetical protein